MLIFLIMLATLGSAFSVLWMQQQISLTAQRTKQIEVDFYESCRKLRYLDERIASFHQPVFLQAKVTGVLRPSDENQVVFVQEREMVTGRSYAVSQPYEVSMDLALLDFGTTKE